MKGTKFLSDILDVSLFEKGVMNVVEAPCGCGKTTCAINRIAPLASSPRKALYLINTKNGCQRLSQEEKLTTPYQYYADDVAGNYFSSEIPDKVVVATYARFGVWVSQTPNFADHFEIIICDEAHNMVQFATFSEEPNYASIARNAIRDAVLIGKTTIIAITATTEYLRKLPCPQKDIPIDRENLHHYTEKETIHYASIEQVLRAIPQDKRGALYTTRIRQMRQFETIARAAGHNPICVWSTENKKDPMSQAFIQISAVFAELELSILRARVRSGMANAAAKGKHIGRPQTTKDDIPAVFYKHYPAYIAGTLNVSELARICGLSRPTVYKYLRLVG